MFFFPVERRGFLFGSPTGREGGQTTQVALHVRVRLGPPLSIPIYFKPEAINRVLGVPLKYGTRAAKGLVSWDVPHASRLVHSERLLS